MKKERFYYSEPLSVGTVDAVFDNSGDVIGLGNMQKISRYPRITICGIWDTDNNTITFGVSRCSKNDIFERSKGRVIARKRATLTPFTTVTISADQKVSDVFINTCMLIEQQVNEMNYPIKLS